MAGINRSTFYTLYKDQYDLLNKYLKKQDFNHSNRISVQVLTRILDYFKDNFELFRALLSENCDFAFQKDILELAQVIWAQMT